MNSAAQPASSASSEVYGAPSLSTALQARRGGALQCLCQYTHRWTVHLPIRQPSPLQPVQLQASAGAALAGGAADFVLSFIELSFTMVQNAHVYVLCVPRHPRHAAADETTSF